MSNLEALRLTEEQIETIQGFASQMAEGLDLADQDFEKRRQLIEVLDVQGTLTEEDGEKVVYARCILGKRLLVMSSTIRGTIQFWICK